MSKMNLAQDFLRGLLRGYFFLNQAGDRAGGKYPDLYSFRFSGRRV